MVSGGAIFLIISVILVTSNAMPKQEKQAKTKSPYLHNYVLMPVKYADKILEKDYERIGKAQKESFAVLKDLQENRKKYPTKVVGHAMAKVMEQGADALWTSFKDIQTLIFPNAVL